MTTLESLQKEIDNLKERNIKVDSNKAWEVSLSRKILLMSLTYIVISLTLITIKNSNPFANAVVPTVAFFLSTLTLPFFKKIWQKLIYKK